MLFPALFILEEYWKACRTSPYDVHYKRKIIKLEDNWIPLRKPLIVWVNCHLPMFVLIILFLVRDRKHFQMGVRKLEIQGLPKVHGSYASMLVNFLFDGKRNSSRNEERKAAVLIKWPSQPGPLSQLAYLIDTKWVKLFKNGPVCENTTENIRGD